MDKHDMPFRRASDIDHSSSLEMGLDYGYYEEGGVPYTGKIYELSTFDDFRVLEADVVDGRIHGWETTYGPDGAVATLGRYRKGILHGRFYRWDDAGNLVSEVHREHNIALEYKFWDSQGNLTKYSKLREGDAEYALWKKYSGQTDPHSGG